MLNWKDTFRQARLEERFEDGTVSCHLSPRNCRIKEGGFGFCKVRGNREGRLVTYNYGKGVHLTEEVVETEAIYHYGPGSPILSLGNVGCMLNCAYCHNWKTSQARYVDSKDVYEYSPDQVVETALRHRIPIISWTYNDPVVWHEFVIDTAKLAREAGLLNLFKSAFFITPEGVDELLPYIDIFAISIKAIDEEYYRRITTGWLQPVLDAAKQVHQAGKHIEISNLMVTDISDDDSSARRMAEWLLTELDAQVPLHFVRFHPDYRMRDTVRTPIARLQRAQTIARDMGVEHVYLGNVYDPSATNTLCNDCGTTLVTRFGLNAENAGLDADGHCTQCGRDAHFTLMPCGEPVPAADVELPAGDWEIRTLDWRGDICSAHVQVRNVASEPAAIYHRRRHQLREAGLWKRVSLAAGESYRFIVSKSSADEIGPEVALRPWITSNLHEVFDRAHYPTVAVEEAVAPTDVSPVPVFPGKQQPLVQLLRRE